MKTSFMRFMALFTLVALLVNVTGCAQDLKDEKGYTYTSYGLLNTEVKSPGVEYKICAGNLIWGIILVETVVAPVYFFGFSIFEPVGLQNTTTPEPPKSLTPTN